MDNSKPILHVEDDEIDCLTVKRVLKTLEITNKLVQKANGEEALEYLTNENNEKPGLILLDLNMPRMNGWEFLQAIRKDPNLSNISVIIVTTSDRDQDITGSNVVGYIVKPIGFNDFVAAIKSEFEKLNFCCSVR